MPAFLFSLAPGKTYGRVNLLSTFDIGSFSRPCWCVRGNLLSILDDDVSLEAAPIIAFHFACLLKRNSRLMSYTLLRAASSLVQSAINNVNVSSYNNIEVNKVLGVYKCVCVCVCVCFLPMYSGHQVRWTYQPGSRRRKVTQDFSSTFLLRCVP